MLLIGQALTLLRGWSHGRAARSSLAVVGLHAGLLSSGCAALGPKIDGSVGAIRWYATDLDHGSPRDPYRFTLVLTQTHAVGMQITKVDWTVYQPGFGPATGTVSCLKTMIQYDGPHVPKCGADWKGWRLPQNGELRLPFQSSVGCGTPCGSTLYAIVPIWQVTVTGIDDDGQPRQAVIDIRLPAR